MMKYPVLVHKSKYGYDVHCPVLPGCHSQGDTFEEALENIQDAIKTYLAMIRNSTKKSAKKSKNSVRYMEVEVGI